MPRDVFILGAGFSKAASQLMPVLSDLSRTVAKSIEHAWTAEWGDDLRTDVELLLTHLASQHPWQDEAERNYDRGKFFDIRDVLVHELQETERRVSRSTDLPDWLGRLVRVWHERSSTVITFNYDTLIERAFRATMSAARGQALSHDCLYPVPVTNARMRSAGVLAGEELDTFRLLKLHGSLNWWYSGPDAPPGDTVYDSLIAP